MIVQHLSCDIGRPPGRRKLVINIMVSASGRSAIYR